MCRDLAEVCRGSFCVGDCRIHPVLFLYILPFICRPSTTHALAPHLSPILAILISQPPRFISPACTRHHRHRHQSTTPGTAQTNCSFYSSSSPPALAGRAPSSSSRRRPPPSSTPGCPPRTARPSACPRRSRPCRRPPAARGSTRRTRRGSGVG